MYLRMAKRVLLETDKRLVWKFFRNMGIRGTMSVLKFKRRLKRGEYFPPFLMPCGEKGINTIKIPLVL